jgi:hypothetical protein
LGWGWGWGWGWWRWWGWMDGWMEREKIPSLSLLSASRLPQTPRPRRWARGPGRRRRGRGGRAGAVEDGERKVGEERVQFFDGVRGHFLPIFHPLLTWRTWASAVAYTTGAGLSAAGAAMVLFFGARDEREKKAARAGACTAVLSLSRCARTLRACVPGMSVVGALICVRVRVCPRARKCGGGRRSKLHK